MRITKQPDVFAATSLILLEILEVARVIQDDPKALKKMIAEGKALTETETAKRNEALDIISKADGIYKDIEAKKATLANIGSAKQSLVEMQSEYDAKMADFKKANEQLARDSEALKKQSAELDKRQAIINADSIQLAVYANQLTDRENKVVIAENNVKARLKAIAEAAAS